MIGKMISLKMFCILLLFQASIPTELYPGANDSTVTNSVVTESPDVNTSTPAMEITQKEVVMPVTVSKRATTVNKEIFSDFITIKSLEEYKISFYNITEDIAFVIFQAHSQDYQIQMYQGVKEPNTTVQGVNIALYSDKDAYMKPFYIRNENALVDIIVYVAVHAYGIRDPIPGGCSMEEVMPTVPYMHIEESPATVIVDAPAPMDPLDPKCLNTNSVNISFYIMYLPGLDHTQNSYFRGIKIMSTMEGIKRYGRMLPRKFWNARRMVARYPGTSRVFAAVATSTYGYSVYAPIVENGCNFDDCYVDELYLLYFYMLTFCVGAYVCFLGNRFFYHSFFLITCYTSSILIYVAINYITCKNDDVVVTISTALGATFALAWILFWFLIRSPSFIVLTGAFSVGCLVSALVYYRFGDYLDILQSDLNFWSLYFCLTLLAVFMLLSAPYVCSTTCTSVVGSYMMIHSLAHFSGSNLKFIMINVINRATVANFRKALLAPPFQMKDQILTMLWIFLFVSGMVFQYYITRGRPSLPSRPRIILLSDCGTHTERRDEEAIAQNRDFHGETTPKGPTENTPLLA